jgi:flavin reductase (DIM6/NTAB) family NADH-FMN oxidoreductase RutF
MSDDSIKAALSRIPYGFYAITSKSDDDTNLMVANWLTQVSFSPRLVALGLQKSSHTHGVISSGSVFAINIFNQVDSDAVMGLTKSREKNPDKVSQATFSDSPTIGCPIVEGAAAYIECKVVQIVDAGGDHDVVIAEVVGAGEMKEGKAPDTLSLTVLGWSYAG